MLGEIWRGFFGVVLVMGFGGVGGVTCCIVVCWIVGCVNLLFED